MKLKNLILILSLFNICHCSDLPLTNYKDTKESEINSPVFSIPGGLYDSAVTVEITSDSPAAIIKYTTDNTMPSRDNGLTYSGPVTITATTNLQAIAYCDNCYKNEIVSEFFIIKKYSLDLVIRDFTPGTNPDFETTPLDIVEGLASADLGADRKPAYANPGDSACITSAETFNQWYNDVQNVNLKILKTINLTRNDDYLVYENTAFFPIDGEGYGNYSYDSFRHNYHFTVEIHSAFVFFGGEVFRFIGDDDIWIFINNRLVIDIGGIHSAREKSIILDLTTANKLGLVHGEIYNLDIFTAERHVAESNFNFYTNAVIVSMRE